MDPEKLNSIYSRAICSPAITRQNLSRKVLMTPTIDNKNDEDDAEFFERLKRKINTDSLKYLQNKYELKKSHAIRKKKSNFHEETTNIIKRFEETIEHKKYIKTDAIKLHSQTKKTCEDNITYNNSTKQSVNANIDNGYYMLSRNFTTSEENN